MGCPITTPRTTEAITTTAIAPTLHTSPTPSQAPGITQDGNLSRTEATVTPTTTVPTSPTLSESPYITNPGPITAVGLYVGIAVPVGLVMIAVTIILILLLFVIHKKRAKHSGKIKIA